MAMSAPEVESSQAEIDGARRGRAVAARLGYGALFTVALPLGLAAWARGARGWVRLPVAGAPGAGLLLAAAGLALVAWAMWALWRRGGGLPMNAFPPPRLVTSGPYRLLAHPIYVGAVAAWTGGALAVGSASALWLVGPALALGAAALVLGYERPDLDARLGPQRRAGLPRAAASDASPTPGQRLGAAARVLLPWALGAAALAGLRGEPWPDPAWWARPAGALPAAALLAALAAPLLPRSGRALRRLEQVGLVLAGAGLSGGALLPSRWAPSLVAGAAVFGAAALALRGPRWWFAAAAWVTALAGGLAATGMAGRLPVAGGLLLGLAALRAPQLWEALRRGAEGIANSWREWRLGPVRVINHGLWAGLASAAGMTLVVALGGRALAPAAVLVWAGSLVGAGLWAQFVEGSPQLLRPFGFYGGVLGAVLAFPVAGALWGDAWRLAAAYAVATPGIQAVGRLRCLVQGCCHGRPAPAWLGIRYHHPRSRVVRTPGLAGVPVHPTPLYSILWCAAWCAALLRLWAVGAPLPALVGASFFLSGVGRFVEESYRGEAQTPSVLGLRLYQWLALASVVGGAALTCVPGAPASPPAEVGAAPWAALLAGAVSAAALGMDLPEGRRRFSRLA